MLLAMQAFAIGIATTTLLGVITAVVAALFLSSSPHSESKNTQWRK